MSPFLLRISFLLLWCWIFFHEFQMVELFANRLYPLSKSHHSNFSPRSIRIQWRIQERLLCRTGALVLRLLMILDRILLMLQMKWSVHQMVNWTIVLKASGHLPINLACFGDSTNTPWLLPTIFIAIQTEPILTKFLFQSSYSSICNSMCGVRFVIPIQPFNSTELCAEMDLGFSSGRKTWLTFLRVYWTELVLHG